MRGCRCCCGRTAATDGGTGESARLREEGRSPESAPSTRGCRISPPRRQDCRFAVTNRSRSSPRRAQNASDQMVGGTQLVAGDLRDSLTRKRHSRRASPRLPPGAIDWQKRSPREDVQTASTPLRAEFAGKVSTSRTSNVERRRFRPAAPWDLAARLGELAGNGPFPAMVRLRCRLCLRSARLTRVEFLP